MEPGLPQYDPLIQGDCDGIGYTGSQRTRRRQLQTFRQAGEHPVSKQTIILDQPPSARSVALMIVRPTKNRTAEQTAYLERLIQSDATVAVVFTLAQDFGRRLAQTRRGVAVGAMESRRPRKSGLQN